MATRKGRWLKLKWFSFEKIGEIHLFSRISWNSVLSVPFMRLLEGNHFAVFSIRGRIPVTVHVNSLEKLFLQRARWIFDCKYALLILRNANMFLVLTSFPHPRIVIPCQRISLSYTGIFLSFFLWGSSMIFLYGNSQCQSSNSITSWINIHDYNGLISFESLTNFDSPKDWIYQDLSSLQKMCHFRANSFWTIDL